jgi:hypothetical protein
MLMRGKPFLIGVIVATIVLYAWQTVSHTVIPWHEATIHNFTNNDAVVQVIHANAPENGVYVSRQGILAAVSFTPAMADKTKGMGGMLGMQIVIDLVTVILLTVVVSRFALITVGSTGATLGIAGIAAGIITEFSGWNWYGFSIPYAVVNTIDLAIGWWLVGIMLAWVYQRSAQP